MPKAGDNLTVGKVLEKREKKSCGDGVNGENVIDQVLNYQIGLMS